MMAITVVCFMVLMVGLYALGICVGKSHFYDTGYADGYTDGINERIRMENREMENDVYEG